MADELVVKPQVSGGSFRTVRVRPGDPVEPLDDAIIQPFIPAVSSEGELSFLFIGGVLQPRGAQGGETGRLPYPAAIWWPVQPV